MVGKTKVFSSEMNSLPQLPALQKGLRNSEPIRVFLEGNQSKPATTINVASDWDLRQLRGAVRATISPGLLPPVWVFLVGRNEVSFKEFS